MARPKGAGRVWAATLDEGLGRLGLGPAVGCWDTTTTTRTWMDSGRVGCWVQRLKANVVLLQHCLVVADAGEQLALWEAAAALAGEERGGDAGRLRPHAVGAGELAITLHFSLLAQLTCEHLLGLRCCGGRL